MPIRPATLADVPGIFELVQHYADRREMLSRPVSELYEQVRDFVVYQRDGGMVGCSRLQMVSADLGEVKSLAVHPDHVQQGIGRALVAACLEEGRRWGLERVFTLTYQPGFFRKVGFHEIEKSRLPQKIWSECVRCPEYPSCGEVPLWIELGKGEPAARSGCTK